MLLPTLSNTAPPCRSAHCCSARCSLPQRSKLRWSSTYLGTFRPRRAQCSASPLMLALLIHERSILHGSTNSPLRRAGPFLEIICLWWELIFEGSMDIPSAEHSRTTIDGVQIQSLSIDCLIQSIVSHMVNFIMQGKSSSFGLVY